MGGTGEPERDAGEAEVIRDAARLAVPEGPRGARPRRGPDHLRRRLHALRAAAPRRGLPRQPAGAGASRTPCLALPCLAALCHPIQRHALPPASGCHACLHYYFCPRSPPPCLVLPACRSGGLRSARVLAREFAVQGRHPLHRRPDARTSCRNLQALCCAAALRRNTRQKRIAYVVQAREPPGEGRPKRT